MSLFAAELEEPKIGICGKGLSTRGRWFDPRTISVGLLMTVDAIGLIPLSPLTYVSTMVLWESSQWHVKNIMWNTGKRTSRKLLVSALAAAI